MHFEMTQKQKKMDDIAVGVVMKALDQGIELPNNEVYKRMINDTPHYQRKLDQRQAHIKAIEKNLKKMKEGEDGDLKEPKKYKFEQLKSKRNLSQTKLIDDREDRKYEPPTNERTIDTSIVKPEDNMEVQY